MMALQMMAGGNDDVSPFLPKRSLHDEKTLVVCIEFQLPGSPVE